MTSPSTDVPAPIIALGIDAANPDLIRGWADDGTLPVLRSLMQRGRYGTVRGLDGFFVGSTWPSFYTARTPARHGFHYTVQLRRGSYDLFNPADRGVVSQPPFWRALQEAGFATTILDVPLVALDMARGGTHLIEWGGHDALYGLASTPPELALDILAHEGRHPQPPNCDAVHRDADSYRALVDALESGAAARGAWTRRLLSRAHQGLLLNVFSEAHCIGHQAWHLHDTSHPAHDPAWVAAHGDPVRRVYRAIDAAIGDIIAEANGATIVVFSCHGMGYWYGAHFLLRDILVRLGVTRPDPEPSRGARAASLARRGWRTLPASVRGAARRLLREPEQAPAKQRVRASDAASRCFPIGNGLAVSGVRINLRGREPDGIVEPGAERDALESLIERELLAVIDDRTGAPLVRSVRRTRDLYDGEFVDDLPDLLIEWSDATPTGSTTVGGGASATVRAHSPRIGTVERRNDYGRTGEHRRDGIIIAAGPGIAPGPLLEPVSVLDLAPTLCAMLGVTLEHADGRPAPALLPDVEFPGTRSTIIRKRE
ncbi:MAG TPA: alkaline phosphatase family protein [Gemmatimonadaceae bacterium]|nr:alkaline phosphatase family protein [Gemmatimonadaceae bacterium]